MLKVNDLFCGAGGMGLGFKQAGFDIPLAVDFDKYAVQTYQENMGDHVKEADISKMTWEDMPQANVWTFGFPCQDLSIAGRKAGLFEGERSSMFFEVMRLLDETAEHAPENLPKMLLAENVQGLKKYLPVLRDEYRKRGYKMYYTLLNSKFWDVPQNRKRYFVAGVHESIERAFDFPKQQEKHVPKLSTVLEKNVDEKYYIKDIKALKIIEQIKEGLKVKEATKKGYDVAKEGDTININYPTSTTRRGRVGKEICKTLTHLDLEHAVVEKEDQPELKKLGGLWGNGKQAGSVWDKEGLSPTLKTPSGGYSEPLIVEEQPSINCLGMLDMKDQEKNRRVYDPDGLAPTLNTSGGGNRQPKILIEEYTAEELQKEAFETTDGMALTCTANYSKGLSYQDVGKKKRTHIVEENEDELPRFRIRKLTPREYARLQGFPDSFKQVVSNTQFYKQMGNAVTVTVAKAIAERIKEFLEGASYTPTVEHEQLELIPLDLGEENKILRRELEKTKKELEKVKQKVKQLALDI